MDGTLTDRYLWADATHLLAVYDATATVARYRFTYSDSRVPLSAETSAGTLRILTDQVGTVRALAKADGTIVEEIERDSFAFPRPVPPTSRSASPAGLPTPTPGSCTSAHASTTRHWGAG